MLRSFIDYLHNLINDHSVNVGDVWAGGLTLGVILQALPTITSILSCLWVVLRLIVLIRDEFIFKKRGGTGGDK